MLFALTLLLSTLALLSTAQPTTTVPTATTLSPSSPLTTLPPIITPRAAPAPTALQKYLSALTLHPSFTPAYRALTSWIPPAALSDMEADPTAYLNSLLANGGGATPPGWMADIPTRYMGFFSSVGVAEQRIVSEASEGAAGG